MQEYKDKIKSIIDGSIIIVLHFIFLIIITILLPILSLGLRLYPKETQIIDDPTQDSL